MRKAIAILFVAAGVAGCGLISTLVDGFKYARAVENDLAEVTGLHPQVSFQWTNGRLRLVTVTFPRVYDAKPVRELAAAVRTAVVKEFKQTPDDVVLAFSLRSAASGTTAQAERTD